MRLSTKRLTRRSPTKISRKQSVARNSADSLIPSSSHSAENLTLFILIYWPSLVSPLGTCASTLICQKPVPELAIIVTMPNFPWETVAPILTMELATRDRGAYPLCRTDTIPCGDQWTDRSHVCRASSWPRDAEPGALVLVLSAANILAASSK